MINEANAFLLLIQATGFFTGVTLSLWLISKLAKTVVYFMFPDEPEEKRKNEEILSRLEEPPADADIVYMNFEDEESHIRLIQ